jgi:hypothetical protein
MSSRARPAPSLPFFRKPAFWLALLVAFAIAVRAWLLFRSQLVPGMNGAYYLVQARSLLEHGRLGIPDLPLTFWLHAGIAKLVQLAVGLPQDTAILYAVKLTDSIAPPLLALPIARLAAQWTPAGERPSTVACLAPAAAVAFGSPLLRMVGDFQKNSLALVWFAMLALAALHFLRRPSLRTMAIPLGLLALLGLTHIGVLGSALVFCGVLAAVALVTAERATRRHIVLLVLLGTTVLGLAGGAAYAFYDPARVTRLVEVFARPASLGDDRGPGRPPGPPPELAEGTSSIPPDQPPDSGDVPSGEFGEPPPPPGQPPGSHTWFDPRTLPSALICWGFAGAAIWFLWRQRRRLCAAEFSVAAAAALTCLGLAAPLYDDQKAERLLLIATVPAAIAASFVLTRIVLLSWSRIVGTCAVAFVLIDSARVLHFGGRASISDATFAELVSLQTQCPDPECTLIVARHGLEWWTAWTLHTHIAQPRAVTPADWTSYSQVLYLREKDGFGLPPDAGLNGQRPPPSDRPAAGTERGPRFGPSPEEMTLPENAMTLHEGASLTLARVPSAPTEIERPGPPPF